MVAGWTGLEPAASGVTGRRSNQLNYHPDGDYLGGLSTFALRASVDDLRMGQPEITQSSRERRLVGGAGLEPATFWV